MRKKKTFHSNSSYKKERIKEMNQISSKQIVEKNSELLETEHEVGRLEEELKEKQDPGGKLKQAVEENSCLTSPRQQAASTMRVSLKQDPYLDITQTDTQDSKNCTIRGLFADGMNLRVFK